MHGVHPDDADGRQCETGGKGAGRRPPCRCPLPRPDQPQDLVVAAAQQRKPGPDSAERDKLVQTVEQGDDLGVPARPRQRGGGDRPTGTAGGHRPGDHRGHGETDRQDGARGRQHHRDTDRRPGTDQRRGHGRAHTPQQRLPDPVDVRGETAQQVPAPMATKTRGSERDQPREHLRTQLRQSA